MLIAYKASALVVTLREIGASWLALDAQRIAHALGEGILQEVTNDDEKNSL
jgi:hypothetical protein